MVIESECRLLAMAANLNCWIANTESSGPEAMICTLGPVGSRSLAGKCAGSTLHVPTANAQSSRNTRCSAPTGAPTIRMWVSRHASALPLARVPESADPSPDCTSLTFMPPVKPILPSTTTILRWVRKLSSVGLNREMRSGLNHASSPPARVSVAK